MVYRIRPVRADDAAALAAIYAPYTATCITFESPAPPAEEFAGRIAAVSAHYPWLVCERDGAPTGYAYAHRFRERAAYDWDAELSVYLAPEARGRGVGKALYSALLSLLTLQGFINAYGTVAAPNVPSERLHLSCGFEHVFTLRRTGWKLGAWRDLAFFHRALGEYPASPASVIPFPELPAEDIAARCEAAARLIRSE